MDQRLPAALQETFISLRQVEPSPIEFPDYDDKPVANISFPPQPPPPPPRSSPLGLSGGGHSSVYYLNRLQKYSSYAFTVFTSFHLANTSIIPLFTRCVPAAENYLLLTRPYYQSIPLEPLLVTLPIALHITSGLALRIHRRNTNLSRYDAIQISPYRRLERRIKVWPAFTWSSVSGYVLAPLVIGHATVNRLLPWAYEGGSSSVGLGFVSHGFAKHPVVFGVSYFVLIGVAAGHFTWGIARWNGWVLSGNGKPATRRWWTINGVSAALAALWMAGSLGVVARGGRAEGWIGKGYDVLLQNLHL